MLASLLQQQPSGHPGPRFFPVAEDPALGPRFVVDEEDAIAVLFSLLIKE